MQVHRRVNTAFSLLELLIVLMIVSTIVAVVIPYTSATREEQLRTVARIVAADLDYARNLAVDHNSSYRVTFVLANNWLVIEHSGTDPTLNVLPQTPFRSREDPANQHRVRLNEMAGISELITIASSYLESDPVITTNDVEFGPLGETTRPETTVLWLSTGDGAATRFIPLRINPVTGTTTVGDMQSDVPPLDI